MEKVVLGAAARTIDNDEVTNLEAIYWNVPALNSALASCLYTTTTCEVGTLLFVECCKRSQDLASERGRS